jgi:hypothetical protein
MPTRYLTARTAYTPCYAVITDDCRVDEVVTDLLDTAVFGSEAVVSATSMLN